MYMLNDTYNIEEIDSYFEAKREEYETTHPQCPECGAYMQPQSENYGLNGPYEDTWYECMACGYCQDR